MVEWLGRSAQVGWPSCIETPGPAFESEIQHTTQFAHKWYWRCCQCTAKCSYLSSVHKYIKMCFRLQLEFSQQRWMQIISAKYQLYSMSMNTLDQDCNRDPKHTFSKCAAYYGLWLRQSHSCVVWYCDVIFCIYDEKFNNATQYEFCVKIWYLYIVMLSRPCWYFSICLIQRYNMMFIITKPAALQSHWCRPILWDRWDSQTIQLQHYQNARGLFC